jgi:chemotaxis family two-component system response regulator Rcp1
MEETAVERFVLVLEENLEQILLIQNAFGQGEFSYRLQAISDGNQAMDFLYRRGEYTNAPRPDLILLDLNLPGKDGREILTELKTSPQLRRIPVVILTLSDREEDIFSSYEIQGNSYVIKSTDLDRLQQIVRRVQEFWLGIVTLPLE